MTTAGAYPVRVEASLDTPSRWLWLVKWLLVIPHYVVLAFLWLAFVLLSVVAFVAIVVTGRYPRPIFEFNVGVLRWSWRVQYYAYGALATDRYPPFTMADVPDYPAHLDVAYPERLSRGLVLVKWWLLAIPHYIVISVFAGGALWGAWTVEHNSANSTFSGGLIGLLAVIAAIVLLFTGRYPGGMYDFVLGMNRWVLRVAAYAALMTDQYPPFRLDLGGHEPSGTLTVEPPPPPSAPTRSGWTAGRITAVVVGALLVLGSLGVLGGGGTALWADRTQRDTAGFVQLSNQMLSTGGYALATGALEVSGPTGIVGDVRITVTSADPAVPVFLGIAPSSAVAGYLSGVGYSTVTATPNGGALPVDHTGGAPAQPPSTVDIWTARASGTGAQTLVWTPSSGQWSVVAMNADGSRGVRVTEQTGLSFPGLAGIAIGLLIGGAVLFTGGVLLVAIPIRGASR